MQDEPPASPDPQIAEMLNDLQSENAAGDLVFLAVVVVRHGGESSRMMTGHANPIMLMGSFEYLKGIVFQGELEQEISSRDSKMRSPC